MTEASGHGEERVRSIKQESILVLTQANTIQLSLSAAFHLWLLTESHTKYGSFRHQDSSTPSFDSSCSLEVCDIKCLHAIASYSACGYPMCLEIFWWYQVCVGWSKALACALYLFPAIPKCSSLPAPDLTFFDFIGTRCLPHIWLLHSKEKMCANILHLRSRPQIKKVKEFKSGKRVNRYIRMVKSGNRSNLFSRSFNCFQTIYIQFFFNMKVFFFSSSLKKPIFKIVSTLHIYFWHKKNLCLCIFSVVVFF